MHLSVAATRSTFGRRALLCMCICCFGGLWWHATTKGRYSKRSASRPQRSDVMKKNPSWFCRYNLVTGQYPFDGDNIFNLFENISKCHYEMPQDISHDLADLLRGFFFFFAARERTRGRLPISHGGFVVMDSTVVLVAHGFVTKWWFFQPFGHAWLPHTLCTRSKQDC